MYIAPKYITYMKDLLDFKNKQIEALQLKAEEQSKKISILETWIFELTDESCPKDYKKVIRTEILKTD